MSEQTNTHELECRLAEYDAALQNLMDAVGYGLYTLYDRRLAQRQIDRIRQAQNDALEFIASLKPEADGGEN